MSVAPPVRQINMGSPGALNTPVLMTDQQTSLQYWALSRQNKILNIQNVLDPAAGLAYFSVRHSNSII